MKGIAQYMETTDWPPIYTIKRHWRAKHVKMVYSRFSGLEITLPKRFSTKHIPSILEENKSWILQQKIKHDRPDTFTRPQEIHFQAFQKSWSIHYFTTDKRPRIREFSANGIILSGEINEFSVCRVKLTEWVRRQAKALLIPYFSHLAKQLQLPFSNVTVRAQSTLWGSCTADHSINLNYKLLFLPEALMRHIMIHELCHTKHMDHSAKFWNLVGTYDQNWRAHKLAMRQADEYMPAWI